MISPDTQEVFMLSDYFHDMANAIGDFIAKNRTNFNNAERNDLYDKQVSLLQLSGDINMLGTSMVFDDVKASIVELGDITKAVKKSVKKALAVQDIINLATSLVQLGTAVLSKNPKEIATKTVDAFRAIKSL